MSIGPFWILQDWLADDFAQQNLSTILCRAMHSVVHKIVAVQTSNAGWPIYMGLATLRGPYHHKHMPEISAFAYILLHICLFMLFGSLIIRQS